MYRTEDNVFKQGFCPFNILTNFRPLTIILLFSLHLFFLKKSATICLIKSGSSLQTNTNICTLNFFVCHSLLMSRERIKGLKRHVNRMNKL